MTEVGMSVTPILAVLICLYVHLSLLTVLITVTFNTSFHYISLL